MQAQPGLPPPAGWALGLTLGGGWNSNPTESIRRTKGDVSVSPEVNLSHRRTLWQGAALMLGGQVSAEFYHREQRESFNRAILTAALSQSWLGYSATISATQRKSMNRDLSRHDTASREIAFAIGRSFPLTDGWNLAVFGRIARRIVEDGTEDQFRAGINATLLHRRGPWIMRLGAGYSYILEDKTAILPRINDRTVSARLGVAYEWKADHELGMRLAFSRTYSSYAGDRYKAYSVTPQISAMIRF